MKEILIKQTSFPYVYLLIDRYYWRIPRINISGSGTYKRMKNLTSLSISTKNSIKIMRYSFFQRLNCSVQWNQEARVAIISNSHTTNIHYYKMINLSCNTKTHRFGIINVSSRKQTRSQCSFGLKVAKNNIYHSQYLNYKKKIKANLK